MPLAAWPQQRGRDLFALHRIRDGLPTVHKRLALAYPGGDAVLPLAVAAHDTHATLTLPAVRT